MRSGRNKHFWRHLPGLFGLALIAAALVYGSAPVVAAKSSTPAKILFGAKKKPAPLKSRAIGFYAKGCLAGGVELPVTGPAWQAMRLERNRNWGHPELVELVKRLAVEAKEHDGWNGLLVGDLAQPRGGPMLTGHASHQVGLDADVWLTPMPNRVLTRKERASKSAVSVIKDRKRINPKVWTDAHAKLIKRAASYPQVQRIFVHPPIKKALCDWSKGQKGRASWLRKVRPFYGHHYHFHIRIRCPKGSSGCKAQHEPRPKDKTGCGGELAHWFSDKPWGKPKKEPKRTVKGAPLPRKKPKNITKKKKEPPKKREITLAALPKACRAVLKAK